MRNSKKYESRYPGEESPDKYKDEKRKRRRRYLRRVKNGIIPEPNIFPPLYFAEKDFVDLSKIPDSKSRVVLVNLGKYYHSYIKFKERCDETMTNMIENSIKPASYQVGFLTEDDIGSHDSDVYMRMVFRTSQEAVRCKMFL